MANRQMALFEPGSKPTRRRANAASFYHVPKKCPLVGKKRNKNITFLKHGKTDTDILYMTVKYITFVSKQNGNRVKKRC